LRVNPTNPEPEHIREAAEVIRGGGLVICPTETVYGLFANAYNIDAVKRIFEVKGRLTSVALPVQVGDASSLEEVALELTECAKRLVERFMPGPITLVVWKNPELPDIVTAGGDTVGVRIPDHPVALALLREVGLPLVATSANRSGEPEPKDAEEAIRQLGEVVDIALDAGATRYRVVSTVVDTTVDPPRILREGAIPAEEIRKVIGRVD